MPLYEYECKACGNRFEKIQKFSDPLVTLCPKCGKESVEQMLSAPAFQFKGSGWYVNDYAAKKSGSSNSEGGASASGTESGSDGKDKYEGAKPESKTETKSESKSEPASAPASAENK